MTAPHAERPAGDPDLRDHFAGVVLPVAFEAIMKNNGIPGSLKAQGAAMVAYEIADAMLVARAKP